MDHKASICQECTESVSFSRCVECDQLLCVTCDENIHRGGKRKTHKRLPLCHSCKSNAVQYCETCCKNFCEDCLRFHVNHTTSIIFSQNYVAVFWDLNCQNIITGEEISQALASLKSLYSRIDIFKVYGTSYFKWKHLFTSTQAEYSHPEGIRESEAILIDISLLNKDLVAEILLISSQASSYKLHLNQIQSGLPKIKIFVSLSFPTLQKISLQSLTSEPKNTLIPPKPSIRPLSNESKPSEKPTPNQFPVYQNFPRKKGQNLSHDHFLTFLKELSDSGQIMHDSGWLCKNFAQRSRISVNESTNIIKEVEALGHIHITQRSFCDLKTTFFTSLRIESLSFESLLWALRSLKVDEMLPTERAIQSRIKEAFEFKVSGAEWAYLVEVCRGMHKHVHTKSAPEQITTNYSLFSSQNSGFSAHPVFVLKEVVDSVTRQKIFVIYPKGEEWNSIDQYIKEGDILGVKGTSDWQAFVDYLTEYFSVCTPGDDSRAIPGGRYGCAEFLKYCGSQPLKSCSLGKLSYMVQLSIDEDLLRYHKTLLIWTPTTPKPSIDPQNTEKLSIIQSKILEVLKENKDGMSLAQLPLYVKRKLNFPMNISELGFAKLKDLLMTMPVIEVEQRGTNHPFAVYRGRRKMQEADVRKAVEAILQDRPQGVTLQKLENNLIGKFGTVVWKDFNTTCALDFIQKKFENIEIQQDPERVLLKFTAPHIQITYCRSSQEPYTQNKPQLTSDSNKISSKVTHSIDYFNPFTSPPGFN